MRLPQRDIATLRAIIESGDPEVRPADRLRAIELLRDSGADENGGCETCGTYSELGDEQLAAELDALFAAIVMTAAPDEFTQTQQALLRRSGSS